MRSVVGILMERSRTTPIYVTRTTRNGKIWEPAGFDWLLTRIRVCCEDTSVRSGLTWANTMVPVVVRNHKRREMGGGAPAQLK